MARFLSRVAASIGRSSEDGGVRPRWGHTSRWAMSMAALAVLIGLPAMTAPQVGAAQATGAGKVTNYTGPGISSPISITSGPDGALWFTNGANNSIGRITTSGKVTNYTGTGISDPQGITVGPDGALWFANYGTNSIGRITTAGVVTNYTGAGISWPYWITVGPDGALWFTNLGNGTIGSIGRITTAGAVTNYTDPASPTRTASPLDPTGRCGSPTTATTRSGGSPPPER